MQFVILTSQVLFEVSRLCECNDHFKGIPSYSFLFLKKIVHDPTKNKLYYLIV